MPELDDLNVLNALERATYDRLVQLLADDFDLDPAAITPASHLRADLALDSLSLTDLAFLVQQDFGFKATPESFQGVTTAGSLARLITSLSSTGTDAP